MTQTAWVYQSNNAGVYHNSDLTGNDVLSRIAINEQLEVSQLEAEQLLPGQTPRRYVGHALLSFHLGTKLPPPPPLQLSRSGRRSGPTLQSWALLVGALIEPHVNKPSFYEQENRRFYGSYETQCCCEFFQVFLGGGGGNIRIVILPASTEFCK